MKKDFEYPIKEVIQMYKPIGYMQLENKDSQVVTAELPIRKQQYGCGIWTKHGDATTAYFDSVSIYIYILEV